MTTTESPSSPNDPVLAEFMVAFEAASDKAATLERYCRDYPAFAERFRSVAAMDNRLGSASNSPTVRRLSPGQMLGEFQIVRFVAAGGMGEIYEAKQITLSERRVALKVIREGHVKEDARARFLREQSVLARLHQTNIVPVFAAGETDGLQYFAMQFIDGASLASVVKLLQHGNHGPTAKTPSLAELVDSAREPANDARPAEPIPSAAQELTPAYRRSVAATIADVAEALDSAHAEQILHRDVKPSNLMVEKSGKCWLIDFGLAGMIWRPGANVPSPAGKLNFFCFLGQSWTIWDSPSGHGPPPKLNFFRFLSQFVSFCRTPLGRRPGRRAVSPTKTPSRELYWTHEH